MFLSVFVSDIVAELEAAIEVDYEAYAVIDASGIWNQLVEEKQETDHD